MYIIPTIYIRDNQTVPLGNNAALFNADPVEMAKRLQSVGAEVLYLNDLNLPPAGHPQHIPIVKKIINETGLKIQLTGNVKSADTVKQYVDTGVERIIAGTIAYQKPDFLAKLCKELPGRIAMAITTRGGKVVITGWTVAARKTPLDYAEQFRDAGVASVFYSDVQREGAITPSDISNILSFAQKSPLPVIHNTDISSTTELDLILGMASTRVLGTVLSKSMYTGIIDIASAITHSKEAVPNGADEPTLIP